MGSQCYKNCIVNGFEWDEMLKPFENVIKKYVDHRHVGYFLEANLKYPEQLLASQNDLPFLPEKLEIGKNQKLACNLKDHHMLNIQKFKTNFKSWSRTKKSL